MKTTPPLFALLEIDPFFSARQVPYLIDLHVFLGRKFMPATKRTSAEIDGVYGHVPQVSRPALGREAAIDGRFAQGILDEERESVERLISGSVDLKNQHQVMMNSYKLYDK